MKSNKSKISCKRGVTLIELLVVVLIIGILAAVAVPQYQRAVEKARMAEAITLLYSLVKAEKIYYLANGEYTDHFNDLDVEFIPRSEPDEAVAQHTLLDMHRLKTDKVIYAQPYPQKIYWRLYYYLDEEKMYCGAKKTEGNSLALCKSFSNAKQPMACGTTGTLECYEVTI